MSEHTTTSLEVLAHRLWVHWSRNIADSEDISAARLDRWQDYWVPYDELPDDVQRKDEELVNRFLLEMPKYPNKE